MKISVIIPSLNSAAVIETAMQSVWNQTYKNVELIVMDGGSRDGTVEILKRHGSRISLWVSEKDKGTSDAVNKGTAKSTGELVTYLAADDKFHDEHVFARVVQEFREHPETKVLCTSLEMVDPKGLVRPYINPSSLDTLHIRGSLHIMGAFFRREVMRDPPLSDSVEIANDYELFAYLVCEAKVSVRVIDLVSVTFSLGGRTNSPKDDFWKARECFYVRRKYFGLWSAWSMFALDMSYACLRRINIRPFTWVRKLRRWYQTHFA